MKNIELGKKFSFLFGSFIFVALFLIFYVHVPLLPVLLGGLVAIVITFLPRLFSNR